MGKINILDSKVFNRIAAGEVVERPASIVKELVENSIDAGATNIVVEIEEGGIKKIRVSDNGSGISFEDLALAFLPHATSKLKTASDLDAISTLGFRGEALASIGSVAEVVLTSATQDAKEGGKIEVTGGTIQKPQVVGSPRGTYIEVSNLFFNIPARAKFLKKPKTEESQITDMVSRFILANPTVSIKYIADGKQIFFSSGKSKEEALFSVYGREVLHQTKYLDFDFGSLKISGFIGESTFSKPNKTYQTLVVNGRYVVNSTVASAVYNAYGDFLMKRQFPFFVLYLDTNFDSVDVNVHPNKLEVRFENNGLIYTKVLEAVNRTLLSINKIASLELQKNTPLEHKDEIRLEHNDKIRIPHNDEIKLEHKDEVRLEHNDEIRIPHINEIKIEHNDEIRIEHKQEPALGFKTEEQKTREVFSALQILHGDKDEAHDSFNAESSLLSKLTKEYDFRQEEFAQEYMKRPHIVGRLFLTYLLIEFNDKLIIVDQHAGHERLLYDKFMAELATKQLATQNLLAPYILKINPTEADFLEENLNYLHDLGFDVEMFGSLTYKVSAVPFLMADINIQAFFNNFFSNIKQLKQLSKEDLIKDQITQFACKHAVKGGDDLTTSEIETLLHAFGDEKVVLSCPHGRPVAIEISKTEIEKWFKRIV